VNPRLIYPDLTLDTTLYTIKTGTSVAEGGLLNIELERSSEEQEWRTGAGVFQQLLLFDQSGTGHPFCGEYQVSQDAVSCPFFRKPSLLSRLNDENACILSSGYFYKPYNAI
jgi:hypothetical protein